MESATQLEMGNQRSRESWHGKNIEPATAGGGLISLKTYNLVNTHKFSYYGIYFTKMLYIKSFSLK